MSERLLTVFSRLRFARPAGQRGVRWIESGLDRCRWIVLFHPRECGLHAHEVRHRGQRSVRAMRLTHRAERPGSRFRRGQFSKIDWTKNEVETLLHPRGLGDFRVLVARLG